MTAKKYRPSPTRSSASPAGRAVRQGTMSSRRDGRYPVHGNGGRRRRASGAAWAFPVDAGNGRRRVMASVRVLGRLVVEGLLGLAMVTGSHAHDAAPDVALLAPGYGPLDYAPPEPGSYRLPDLGAATDAPVIASDGNAMRLHETFGDGVTLLAFIYTHCDDVNGCPLASFVMRQIAKALFDDPRVADALSLVSYSFDPERDTPAVLAEYARTFRPAHARWRFVTAPDAEALETALGGYGQSVTRASGDHAFAHVLRVFLIDASHRIRNVYSTAFLHEDLVRADILTLVGESDGTGASGSPRTAATAAARHMSDGADGRTDHGLGLPRATTAVENEAAVRLGERLFFDRRLSLNKTISCAMCHVPAQGFTSNEVATAVGIEGRTVRRNAPTLLNVGVLGTLFHDGRERRLEHQVWQPLLADNEMGNPSIGYVLGTLEGIDGYPQAFEAAFGEPVTMAGVGRALAAFERSLVAGGSAFDRYRYGGDATALTAAERRGLSLFLGKGDCASCHLVGPDHATFTDQHMHNTGVGYLGSMYGRRGRREVAVAPGVSVTYDLAAVAAASAPLPNDLGRYEVTQDPADRWKYRTPSLRNVAVTAPYMHDGSLATLADVVEFYDRGGVPNDGLDPRIRPLGLTGRERADLVAFLESLTSPRAETLARRFEDADIGNP